MEDQLRIVYYLAKWIILWYNTIQRFPLDDEMKLWSCSFSQQSGLPSYLVLSIFNCLILFDLGVFVQFCVKWLLLLLFHIVVLVFLYVPVPQSLENLWLANTNVIQCISYFGFLNYRAFWTFFVEKDEWKSRCQPSVWEVNWILHVNYRERYNLIMFHYIWIWWGPMTIYQ